MKKKIIDEETEIFLSKKVSWIILACLVLLDAYLDLTFAEGKGLESPIWKPIANLLGINNPLFLIPLVLLIFYFGAKVLAFLIEKIDKVQKAEELFLTTLVIVYGFFDLWLISVYFFGFTLFKNHYYLIPILIIIGIAYSWWVEKKLKK